MPLYESLRRMNSLIRVVANDGKLCCLWKSRTLAEEGPLRESEIAETYFAINCGNH
jgi:hypothetical protein